MQPRIKIVVPTVELMTPSHWFDDMAIIIEECGRTSHKSEERIGESSAEPFIKKIAFKKGHESIIEHCSITVRFVCSRACSHQLVRHRIAAYTQESQRYVDYSKEGKFNNAMNIIMPPSIAKFLDGGNSRRDFLDDLCEDNGYLTVFHNPEDLDPSGVGKLYIQRDDKEPMKVYTDFDWGVQWTFFNALLTYYESYLYLRDKNIPPEDARFVLPNASKTEVATTYDLREWRHVFKMRCTKHAQWEIRSLMQMTLRMFIEYLPVFFDDLKPLTESSQ